VDDTSQAQKTGSQIPNAIHLSSPSPLSKRQICLGRANEVQPWIIHHGSFAIAIYTFPEN
jgi:hypothetical protein